MKGKFIIVVVLIAIIITACSTPGGGFAYYAPVDVSETEAFVGTALQFAQARTSALEKGIAAGYTKILAEYVEVEGSWGKMMVTLIMTK